MTNATGSGCGEVLIAAKGVKKTFDASGRPVKVLHGVGLTVSGGEMVAIMGPSGSGKSTLMYCLAGLEDPTEGSVTLVGEPMAGASRRRRAQLRRTEVGFVFQQYNLVPTLTALQNVELPYLLRGERPPRDVALAQLDRLGLASLVDSRPPQLSGGEQQRVALARVLAQQPKVVFADEPTGALDTTTGAIVLRELHEISRQQGRCVLTVTHDPVVAARCDRVLFLVDGKQAAEVATPTASEVSALMAELTKAVA